jgi:hypothetical protein
MSAGITSRSYDRINGTTTGDSSKWRLRRKVRGYWRPKGAVAPSVSTAAERTLEGGRFASRALLAKTLGQWLQPRRRRIAAMEKAAEFMAAHNIAVGVLRHHEDIVMRT